jgi:DNA-binding NarL/FixJ family response regulator
MAADKNRIIVCSNHALIRTGIISILSKESNLYVVNETNNGAKCIDIVKNDLPDLIITDISLDELNGFELLKILLKYYPRIKIMLFSLFNDNNYINKTFNLGGYGYFNMNISQGQLLYYIDIVLSGKKYFGEKYKEDVLNTLEADLSIDKKYKNLVPEEHLSPLEEKIIFYISKGKTSKEIADLLLLSKRTIDSYRHNIMKKNNLKNLVELVNYSICYFI